MSDISSEEQTGEGMQDDALKHGFTLDCTDLMPYMLATNSDFKPPTEDVADARRNRWLQRRHPVEEGKSRYLVGAKACSKCGASPDALVWFYFESPKVTWETNCGCAGWIVVCDRCNEQVSFFDEVIS